MSCMCENRSSCSHYQPATGKHQIDCHCSGNWVHLKMWDLPSHRAMLMGQLCYGIFPEIFRPNPIQQCSHHELWEFLFPTLGYGSIIHHQYWSINKGLNAAQYCFVILFPPCSVSGFWAPCEKQKKKDLHETALDGAGRQSHPLVYQFFLYQEKTMNINLGKLKPFGVISLTNHYSQWGRSEVVTIYPDQWLHSKNSHELVTLR